MRETLMMFAGTKISPQVLLATIILVALLIILRRKGKSGSHTTD